MNLHEEMWCRFIIDAISNIETWFRPDFGLVSRMVPEVLMQLIFVFRKAGSV